MSSASQPIQITRKRLIICCDGAWMNSDTGYRKPSYSNPVGKAVVPSNVTRLSRSLRRYCTDGTLQVTEYHSGIGSSGSLADVFSGGAFSLGVSENIRSAYSFICANFTDGDEVILVGFSRGAFTARSDTQHWRDGKYKDPFPDKPFGDKPKGEDAPSKYRAMLTERGLTRIHQNQEKGPLIRVKAIAVEYRFYDTILTDRIEYAFHALALDEHRPAFSPTVWERTIDSLYVTDLRQVWFPGNHVNVGGGWKDAGISDMSLAWMMDQLASTGVEFDEAAIMRLFDELEHSYRDMAEKDPMFPHARTKSSETPAVIEPPQEDSSFLPEWLRFHLPTAAEIGKKIMGEKHWAIEPICESNMPLRPWALGAIRGSNKWSYKVAGSNIRSPCAYKKRDPITGKETNEFLEDTNERMHSSVRVRLALHGLGLNDRDVWEAPALKGRWAVRKTAQEFLDPIPKAVASWEKPEVEAGAASTRTSTATASWKRKLGLSNTTVKNQGDNTSPAASNTATLVGVAAEQQRPLQAMDNKGYRWLWEYCGKEKDAPPQRVMVEEPLGPFERQLLRLSGGVPNVYEFAETVEGMDGRKV
ncbi:hypothetical protein QBC40DRAFT_331910 [Triangularia verruculosa]|uniref:T6SS Phospholipase effector Tle1-like catalytic domain-containing protein n=1 Tax=Triangularia verruculosa TaxID=2587418 RepID=A0AAN6XCW0_9PEZI|nr:hypothetical protein QBC40DRAFT_331910 [Triangularia verruculosa]